MVSRQAIPRIQSIALFLVIVIAIIAGIWYYTQSVPETNPNSFSMKVIPRPFTPMKGEEEIPKAIAGQRVVFLVVIEENGHETGSVDAAEISVTASRAAVSINNPIIKAGEIAEVTVIPDQTSINKILTITINGDRSGFKQTETVEVELIDWEDNLEVLAAEMRDKFVPWLVVNHPEFSISSETEWIWNHCKPGNSSRYALYVLFGALGDVCNMACNDSSI